MSIGQLIMVQDIPDWSCNVSVCIVSEESRTTYQSEYIQEGLENMIRENDKRIWEKKRLIITLTIFYFSFF